MQPGDMEYEEWSSKVRGEKFCLSEATKFSVSLSFVVSLGSWSSTENHFELLSDHFGESTLVSLFRILGHRTA